MKKKNALVMLVGILFLYLCFPAFAEDFTRKSFFEASPNDVSLHMLRNVFGSVGTVFHGSGFGIFNEMFREFNHAMMALATIIIMYTALMGIINTAYQGEFLGKKMDSIWLPLRVVSGFALIVPTTTGYSTIQIFMMWVVTQGVGAADSLWMQVIKYLKTDNSLYAADSVTVESIDTDKGTSSVTGEDFPEKGLGMTAVDLVNMTKCFVCMHNEYIKQYIADHGEAPDKDSDFTKPTVIKDNDGSIVYDFTKPYGCGYFKIKPTTSSEQYGKKNDVSNGIEEVFSASTISVLDDVGKYAAYGIYGKKPYELKIDDYKRSTCIVNQDADCKSKGDSNYPITMVKKYPDCRVTCDPHTDVCTECEMVDSNKDARDVFISKCTAASTASTGDACLNKQHNPYVVIGDSLKQDLSIIALNVAMAIAADVKDSGKDSMYSYGWASAGSYYKQLAQLKTKSSSTNYDGVIVVDTTGVDSKLELSQGSGTQSTPGFLEKLKNDIKSESSSDYTGGSQAGTFDSSGFYGQFLEKIKDMMAYQPLDQSQGSITDPIVKLQEAGEDMGSTAQAWYIGFTAGYVLFAGVAGICASSNPGFVIVDTLLRLALLPVFALLAALYIFSFTLSIYIPFVPYMIFNFGVLSWLLAVLETMIAAPMVALGLTHPEGHEIYGKAEPAVMLLTNVFLRPSLMIFGFIGGIIICFIGVNFINFSFQYFIGNVGTGGLQKGGLHVLFIAVIYIYLVIAIVNMAFSLIHIIPDKVLSWIQGGAQSQFGEYSKAGEQTVKGGFESSAGKVEKTAGEFGAEARKNQVKYEKEKTEGDAASVQLKKE